RGRINLISLDGAVQSAHAGNTACLRMDTDIVRNRDTGGLRLLCVSHDGKRVVTCIRCLVSRDEYVLRSAHGVNAIGHGVAYQVVRGDDIGAVMNDEARGRGPIDADAGNGAVGRSVQLAA